MGDGVSTIVQNADKARIQHPHQRIEPLLKTRKIVRGKFVGVLGDQGGSSSGLFITSDDASRIRLTRSSCIACTL